MKNRNVFLIIIITLCLIAALMPIKTRAAGSYDKPGEDGHNLAEAISCHTFANADGSTDIVYCVNTDGKLKLNIDNFSKSGKRKRHKIVSVSGTVWGGTVYAARDGNYYIATGSTGMEKAAYYIQKYDKNWTILGTATVYPDKEKMVSPFYGGNCDMTWKDGMLIVHTCMNGLVEDVGEIHQYNYTFIIDTATMDTTITYPDMTMDSLHVSHSFTQFVRCDGRNIITVDHGDGYPRAVYLHSLPLDGLDVSDAEPLGMSLLDMRGKIGYNCTGVTVDGFELGRDHHIVVGTSIPHESFASDEDFNEYDELYGMRAGNNIYVSLVDKNFQSSSRKWLTDFSIKENKCITTLECIPLENDRFVLLYGVEDWNEEGDAKEADDITCYQIIDSNGNILQSGSIKASFYCTSEPSYCNGVITWCHYVDNKLGTFMAKSDWNINTGKFSTVNLKLGIKSRIGNIIALDDSVPSKPLKTPLDCSIGDTVTVTFAVTSKAFDDGDFTAPVLWTASNTKVVQVLKQETILGGSIVKSTTIDNYIPYKEISTDIYIMGSGTAKITCTAGDKKESVKIKVSAKKSSFRKKRVKLASVRSKKKGEIIVKWKKVSDAEGYEVQYSEYKDIENNNRTSFETDSSSQTSIKIDMYLERRKTYYVRVRAYKK